MTAITSIATPRLWLASMHDADAPVYVALYTDPRVMSHVVSPLSDAQALVGFAIALDEDAGLLGAASWWIVRDRIGARACGLVGTRRDRHLGLDRIELGVLLLPHAQRHGFACEALAALVDRLKQLGWHGTLVIHHRTDNAPMGAVAAALGFAAVAAPAGVATNPERVATRGQVRWERMVAPTFASASRPV